MLTIEEKTSHLHELSNKKVSSINNRQTLTLKCYTSAGQYLNGFVKKVSNILTGELCFYLTRLTSPTCPSQRLISVHALVREVFRINEWFDKRFGYKPTQTWVRTDPNLVAIDRILVRNDLILRAYAPVGPSPSLSHRTYLKDAKELVTKENVTWRHGGRSLEI